MLYQVGDIITPDKRSDFFGMEFEIIGFVPTLSINPYTGYRTRILSKNANHHHYLADKAIGSTWALPISLVDDPNSGWIRISLPVIPNRTRLELIED